MTDGGWQMMMTDLCGGGHLFGQGLEEAWRGLGGVRGAGWLEGGRGWGGGGEGLLLFRSRLGAPSVAISHNNSTSDIISHSQLSSSLIIIIHCALSARVISHHHSSSSIVRYRLELLHPTIARTGQ